MQSSEMPRAAKHARRRNKKLPAVLIIGALCLLAGLAVRQALYQAANAPLSHLAPARRPEINAPFIVSPDIVVEKMVEMAELTPGDLVYDLGCGDGRIVVTAAILSGCRGVGVDIDPQRVLESTENAKRHNVADRVEIREQNVFDVDLSGADEAMVYLTGWMINKLAPQFEKMAPASRILTHNFWIEQVHPDQVVFVPVDGSREHIIYLYTTPLKKDPTMEKGKPPQPEDAAVAARMMETSLPTP